MTPYEKAGFNELTLFRVVDSRDCGRVGQIVCIEEDDGTDCPVFNSAQERNQCHTFQRNLTELPKDADGFYLWEGGDMPVPGDWGVEYKLRAEGNPVGADALAAECLWGHGGSGSDVIAFKPTSRPDMPVAVKPVASIMPIPKQPDILTKARELQAMLPDGAELEISSSDIRYCEDKK